MTATNFTTVEATTVTANLVGNVTGNVAGNVTGNVSGLQTLPAVTAYTGADAGTLAISPAIGFASMTKASAGAYTLAAPGAGNVGKLLFITCGTANAHVITVTGLANGNTLTMTNTVGSTVLLLAISATVWAWIAGAAAQTNV
jgi:hypothetical protein